MYKLLLIKEHGVANAAKDMDFYTVYLSKGSFTSVISVSEDKIFVGGTQGVLDYKEISDIGNEYSIKDLYNKNKGYNSLSELAKKIEIADKNPMADDNTREEFEANESPNTNTHLRTQIYQMIEELDGKPIDTDKYLVDKDGKVIKKDSDGNIIKAKKLNQNINLKQHV